MDGAFIYLDGAFIYLDGEFVEVDGRFVEVDGRLVQVDGRLVQVDGRFVQVVLYPNIIGGGHGAACIAGIDGADRLYEQDLTFGDRDRFMFDPFGHDNEFASL